MSNNFKIKLLRKLIREVIQANLLSEDGTPGGGLTKFGAKYKIQQSDAIADAMKALAGSDGDAGQAAKALGISKRRMYDYIQQSPKLDSAQDRFQDEEKDNDSRPEKFSKSSNEENSGDES